MDNDLKRAYKLAIKKLTKQLKIDEKEKVEEQDDDKQYYIDFHELYGFYFYIYLFCLNYVVFLVIQVIHAKCPRVQLAWQSVKWSE